MSSKNRKRAHSNGHYPHALANPIIERQLLGALVRWEASPKIWQAIDVSDFFLEDHQRIYRRMQALTKRGEPIGYITVCHELEAHGETTVTLSYLIELGEGVPEPSESMWRAHVRILKEASARRRMALMGKSLELAAGDPEVGLELLMAETSQNIAAIGGISRDDLPESKGHVWTMESHTTYLIDNFLAERSVTMISGESGDGKSMLGLSLGRAVAEGAPFLGRPTISRPVLYLDREMPLYVVKDRLYTLGIPDLFPRYRIWGGWEDEEPPGPDSPQLAGYVERTHSLVIFDPLIRNLNGADENDASQIRRHMTLYRRLTEIGGTVLLMHHRSEKGENDYRGSSDLRAAVDSAWRLSRDDGSTAGDPLSKMVLTPYKLRAAPSKPVRFEFSEGQFMALEASVESPLEMVISLVRVYPGRTQSELLSLAKAQGISKPRLTAVLHEALLQGQIEVRSGNKGKICYFLAPPPLIQ